MDILFYVFIVLSIINVIHFGLYLVGADYYDMQQAAKKAARGKRRGKGPLVSVLVPAHNEELSIVRSLDSIRRSTYRNIEIIVVDDASTDNTRRLVREYIARHKNRNIRLMWKRKNGGKAKALNHALKQGAHGELIMTLDADSLLDKKSIANAVRHFDDPKIVGVAANVKVLDSQTVLGLVQKFEYLVGYRSKKFFSVTNSEFIVGGVASTYRADVLKKVGFYDDDIITEDIALSLKIVAQGNKENRIMYGADVLAWTQGVPTFKSLLRQRYRWKMGNIQSIIKHRYLFAKWSSRFNPVFTWYRIPMAFVGEFLLLLEPFALIYVAYLCVQLTSFSIVVGAYLVITAYLVLNVMSDEHLSFAQKLRTCAYAPAMYFLMYIMNIVQLTAIIRCLMHPRKMTRRGSNVSSAWVSPERQALA